MKTVLITGGTGLVGKYLSKKLIEKGYVVATLGRQSKKQSDIPNYTWNIEKNELENSALENVDYIKIDVDGYELQVLQGALNTIEKYLTN